MPFSLGDQAKIQHKKHDTVFNTETMLNFSEIRNDTILLKDGGLRAILKITGLNLDLKNFDEQEIILQQYKKFLNALSFPIQILVRNTYLDLSWYIWYVNGNLKKISNKTLLGQGQEYAKFLENIDLQQGLIYVKEFYIIVPFYADGNDNKQIKKSRVNKLMSVLNSKDNVEKIVARYRSFLKNKSQLDMRCSLITDGLSGIGIPCEKIWTSDIINLLFRYYNPLLHNAQAEPNMESAFSLG